MTPEQEEAVRRALAATARAEDDALPPEVAARLDDRLAGLVSDRSGRSERSLLTGARTGSRPQPSRAPRRWPRVLAAAAAVVVVAGGGSAVVHSLGGSGSASSSSASRAGSGPGPASAGPARSAASAGPTRSAAGAAPPTAAGGEGGSPAPGRLPDLRTATLHRDVQRAAARAAAVGHGNRLRPESAGRPPGACAVPSLAPGRRALAVRLDGRPATLVLPRAAGPGVARIYPCGAPATPATPAATTTVLVH